MLPNSNVEHRIKGDTVWLKMGVDANVRESPMRHAIQGGGD